MNKRVKRKASKKRLLVISIIAVIILFITLVFLLNYFGVFERMTGKTTACSGGLSPQPETCNKIDDDCDGQIDEGCPCKSENDCPKGTCFMNKCVPLGNCYDSDGGKNVNVRGYVDSFDPKIPLIYDSCFREDIVKEAYCMQTSFGMKPIFSKISCKKGQVCNKGKCIIPECGSDRDCKPKVTQECSEKGELCTITQSYHCVSGKCDPTTKDIQCNSCQYGTSCTIGSCKNNFHSYCKPYSEKIADDCCKELFPGVNINNSDRINIVFIGMQYADKNMFIDEVKSSINYYGDISLPSGSVGLLQMPPYNYNKNKFNFWYSDKILDPQIDDPSLGIEYCSQCANINSGLICSNLPNTYYVNLCKSDFRSCAYFGGASHTSTVDRLNNWPNVFIHEFQHQFPQLRDEYVEFALSEAADVPGPPNCAPDLSTAREWWGQYEGQYSEDKEIVGYYDGCSYVLGNYRPTDKSLMSEPVFYLGLVNEIAVNNTLKEYSGMPTTLKNAVELTLEGTSGDINSYTLKNIKSTSILTSEKTSNKNLPYKIRLKTVNKEYIAPFDIYDTLIEESFNSQSKKISLVSYKKNLKKIIKVKILTGQSFEKVKSSGYELSLEDKDSKILKKLN